MGDMGDARLGYEHSRVCQYIRESNLSNPCVWCVRLGRCVQVSRKHLLEHVVPTLVSLKACLERAHSPLVRDVMEYFQVGWLLGFCVSKSVLSFY